MTASLHTVPSDVLQHIAYLLATTSGAGPLQHIQPLLATCSIIYRTLNAHGCPHLYADIFRATFDFDHTLHSHLTDSALTVELHLRHRFLWRTLRQDILSDLTLDEVWAGMRMVLENAGRNQQQLAAARFSTFIFAYVQQRLRRTTPVKVDSLSEYKGLTTMSLVMWLLCLTLTHQNVIDIPEITRDELNGLLSFPTTYARPPSGLGNLTPEDAQERSVLHSVIHTSDPHHIALLAQANPIIILAFSLKEAVPVAIPPHLPRTRAIAIATQRSGPTVEDFYTIVDGRTPLFADTLPAQVSGVNPVAYISNPAHLVAYKSRLRTFLLSSYIGPSYTPGHVYVPGSLAGLWEGSFMMSCEPKPVNPLSPLILGDFKYLKPMQCAITEYLCFSPHLPLPSEYPVNLLESAVKSRKIGYEKHSPASNTGACPQRDPSEALDVIILGKTLHDHEQAWNGFKFVGRARSDGFIFMYREPKGQANAEGLGTWIFEGHLRYGVAFVGQWRSSIPTTDCDLRGIFSLRKTDAAWQD